MEKPSALKREHLALQNMKFLNFLKTFLGSFCPPASGFRIQIWIPWPYSIWVQSGSEKLVSLFTVTMWSGLVCVVLHRALWAHVRDFGVALCRCALNHVSFFSSQSCLLLATKLPFSFSFSFVYFVSISADLPLDITHVVPCLWWAIFPQSTPFSEGFWRNHCLKWILSWLTTSQRLWLRRHFF